MRLHVKIISLSVCSLISFLDCQAKNDNKQTEKSVVCVVHKQQNPISKPSPINKLHRITPPTPPKPKEKCIVGSESDSDNALSSGNTSESDDCLESSYRTSSFTDLSLDGRSISSLTSTNSFEELGSPLSDPFKSQSPGDHRIPTPSPPTPPKK